MEGREEEYQVVWVNEENERQSSGKPIPKSSAESWVKKMNRKYPGIKHEAIPVQKDKNNS